MRIFGVLLLLWPLAAAAQDDASLEAFLNAPPAPLNLVILEDASLAREAVITPKGGSITLDSADGDRFKLTFPAGAVLTPTTIRATPIASSDGLPDGAGQIAGLILQPDGLELARTATLEITPKTPIPPESRLHWGFYEDGKDAFLHVPVPDTDAIMIPIDHFSGAGIGFADRADLQMERWKQKRIEDRISTQIVEALRMDKLNPPDHDTHASFMLMIKARAIAEEGRARIALHPSATCTDIKDAIRTIMQVGKTVRLASADGGEGDDGSRDLLWKLIDRGLAVCLDEALQICLASGDLRDLVAFAIQFRRMIQNVGPKGADTPENEMDGIDPAIRAAMERCGRYKLTVQSKGHWVDGVGVYGDVNFKVEVPIRLKFTFSDSIWAYALEGEAPATDVTLTFVDYACWKFDRARQGAPMQARISNLVFDQDHAPKRVTLAMRSPELFAVTSCVSKKRGKKTIESPVSETSWGIAHAGNRAGPGYVLQTMKAGSHPKLFSYSWEGKGTAAGVTSNDTTQLTLEHIGG